jgi:hypothetical protein
MSCMPSLEKVGMLYGESGHIVRKKWWYAFTLGVSLQADLYMTQED